MTDDYLWDPAGPAHPDVARLERALQPLGHDGRPFDWTRVRHEPRRRAPLAWIAPLALAASVAWLVIGVGPDRSSRAAWTADALAGAVTMNGRPVTAATAAGAGQWIETGASGRARLQAAGVGTLELGPGTRLRVLEHRPGRYALALAAGSMQADISSAPGAFTVATAAARAIDLGCRYTLDVDRRGAGTLRVTLGWVALEAGGYESLVPAGAACATRAAGRPGTPWFDDAAPAFVDALSILDGGPPAGREAALATVLGQARPLDALTLWHLLGRLDRGASARVYERLAALTPPPPSATLDAVLDGRPQALADWWETIGFGRLEDLRVGLARAR